VLYALAAPDAQFLLMKVYKELLLCDADTPPGIETLVLNLLQLAGRQRESPPGWAHRVKELLHNRWDAVITLQELSAAAGLHPCNLSAWFPRYFGCGISEYRRKLKIEKAIGMIGGDQSLTDIAYTCGFADQSHFTRVFKSLTGWCPKPYEKTNVG
jgi:AraC family transcriptional regulator